jgi:3-oxoacyl-[acyl-carrier protein] reductase
VLCSRTPDPLTAASQEIQQKSGVEVLARPTDVTKETDVRSLVDAALDRFGRIDILVANAGGPPSTRFTDTGLDAWRDGLDLNLMSTILLSRSVVPTMRQRRWGRIVAIASVSAKQPLDGLVISNVSRLGVVALAKSMASELASDNVLVNVVCPGYTRTERLEELASQIGEREKLDSKQVYQRWTQAIPMGRLGEPAELAALVAFLVSDKASYITGTCIQVDGGFVRAVF